MKTTFGTARRLPYSTLCATSVLFVALGCSSGEGGPGSGNAGGTRATGGGGGGGNPNNQGSAGATGGSSAAVGGRGGLGGTAGENTGAGGQATGGAGQAAGGAGQSADAGAAGHASAGGAGQGGVGDVGGSGGVTGGGGGSGSVETVHLSGRWNIQNGGARATTVNSGSYVIAQFTGTGITAKFDISVNVSSDMPTVGWSVDGSTTWKVAEVAGTLPLASGLPSGMHTITMIARGLDENRNRWSPPLASSITFLGFDVTGGALDSTPRPAQPKLEILGDSITEGVIVQGSSYMGHSEKCWTNDAIYSYATLTGRALNADYRQVGFGYQGLLKGGNGGVPAANDSFNWIYANVPRDSWQADMVVINQGTNDGSQPASTFKAAYSTFLKTIRAAYPGAKIVALRPFNGSQAAQIQAAVADAKGGGDARVYYVDTTGWLGTGDFSDSLHPNVQGGAKASAALVTALKAIGFP